MTLIVAQYAFGFNVTAATRSWDGGGANSFWDATANWSNNVAPVNGDAILFPDGTPRLINTNRVSVVTNVASLRFIGDGYQVYSVPLHITDGITNVPLLFADPNTLNAVIHVAASQSWFVASRRSLILNSNVVFPAAPVKLSVNIASTGTLTVNGRLAGNNSAEVVKLGSGRLDLKGSTNTVHTLVLADGTLTLDTGLGGLLVISNGASLQGTGVVQSLICAGEVRPGGAGAGTMTFTSTNSNFEAGGRLVVDLKGLTAGLEYDQLRTRGVAINGAELSVQVAANFNFAIGQKFVIIENANIADSISGAFANLPQGGRLTNNGIVFQANYTGKTGNDL